jgi:hypothetical protein
VAALPFRDGLRGDEKLFGNVGLGQPPSASHGTQVFCKQIRIHKIPPCTFLSLYYFSTEKSSNFKFFSNRLQFKVVKNKKKIPVPPESSSGILSVGIALCRDPKAKGNQRRDPNGEKGRCVFDKKVNHAKILPSLL